MPKRRTVMGVEKRGGFGGEGIKDLRDTKGINNELIAFPYAASNP